MSKGVMSNSPVSNNKDFLKLKFQEFPKTMSAEYIEFLRRKLNSKEAFLEAKQRELVTIESTIKELKEIKEDNKEFLQQKEYDFLKKGLEERINILEDWKILWNEQN